MILDAYAAFLTAAGLTYFTNNGFSVKIGKATIDVAVSRSGMVTISAYVGLVNFMGPAKRLCSELIQQYPEYRIWPEKYNDYYEIEVERVFPYTTIPDLHKLVVDMAEMVEEGYAIGKTVVGEEFCR